MARHHMYVESSRAGTSWASSPTSVDAALDESVRWYRDNGYVAA